jgi:hypothetical protein
MKRAQVIIQNFELLNAGGDFGQIFSAPQNIVEITAPENFNVTRVTFQSYIERPYTLSGLKPFCTLNSSPPALPGDGYVFFPQILFDAVTGLFNVYIPQQTISFESFLDAKLQGNFYAAFCTDPGERNGRLTVVWEGYYNE